MVLVAVWLSTQHFGKIMGVKHTVLPGGQVLTVKSTVFAQILGPKTDEKEDRYHPVRHNSERIAFECRFHVEYSITRPER